MTKSKQEKLSLRKRLQQLLEEEQKERCTLTDFNLLDSDPKSQENGFDCTWELDHRIPLAKGGTDDFENLQFICRTVNKAKHTLKQEVFIEICCAVAKHCRGYKPPQKRIARSKKTATKKESPHKKPSHKKKN